MGKIKKSPEVEVSNIIYKGRNFFKASQYKKKSSDKQVDNTDKSVSIPYIKVFEEEKDKIRKDEKKRNIKNRLDEMDKEEGERRRDILDYQAELLIRGMNKTNTSMKKNHSGYNSITNQIALQSYMGAFNKKLNILKSQSVFKMPIEEKVKIYKDIKRKEAERIKREKEDELYNKSH